MLHAELVGDAEQLGTKARHRMFGSMPRTSTTSRLAPGGGRPSSRVVGQVISPASRRRRCSTMRPVDLEVVVVLGVERGDGSASQISPRWSIAPDAASPASFQPSNAAIMTGSTSSGTPVELDHAMPPIAAHAPGAGRAAATLRPAHPLSRPPRGLRAGPSGDRLRSTAMRTSA